MNHSGELTTQTCLEVSLLVLLCYVLGLSGLRDYCFLWCIDKISAFYLSAFCELESMLPINFFVDHVHLG